MLKNISSFIKSYSGNKKMGTKKIIFIVEADIQEENPTRIIKKIRAVRKQVKIGVNSIEGVKATRIANKDK